MIPLLVNAIGLIVIGWIVWYFWLWKPQSVTAESSGEIQRIDVTVKGGYQPSVIEINAGKPVRLTFTRREASTCGEEVVIPAFGKRLHLPENEAVPVDLVPDHPGEYEFTCGMGMYRGKLIAH